MYVYNFDNLSLFLYTKSGKIAYIKLVNVKEKENIPQYIKDVFDSYFINKKDIPILDIFLMPKKYEDVYKLLKEKTTFGKLITYKELGSMLNIHHRAIARAMKINPLPIFIPCHRVVPTIYYKNNKNIGGYNGGIDVKKFLLQHEGINI